MPRSLQLVPERAHIKFQGDKLRCARMLPYARKLLRTLILQSSYPSTHDLSKRIVVPGLAQIEVRTIGAERFIKITALGCKDRRGFFLTRTTGGVYSARYNDEVVEIIDPITGLPRPDPETADRTIGYVVPSQLQGAQFDITAAAKFSGLMRSVVGCRHSAGLDAPFSYTWTRTHGIVKLSISVGDPPTTRTRYWIVEVSSAGVFAAPIKHTRRCCDSWDVTKYQPTDAEIEEDPTLAQHRTLLSLEWAFSVERPGVTQLVSTSEMDAAYALGDPWSVGTGWAFSASGAQAQNVIVDTVNTLGFTQYQGTRHVLSFDTVDAELTCELTTPDLQKIATLWHQCCVLVPASDTIWSFEGRLISAGDFVVTLGGTVGVGEIYEEASPMHVYFEGETAVVTRYELTMTRPVSALVAFGGFHSSKYSSVLLRTVPSGSVDGTVRTSFILLPSDREAIMNLTNTLLGISESAYGEIDVQLNVGPVQVNETDVGSVLITDEDFFEHDLSTFIIPEDNNDTATSRVFAQHGNLFFDDPRVTPANQYGNAAYVFAPGARISSGVYAPGPRILLGGFIAPTAPDELIGFVGKA